MADTSAIGAKTAPWAGVAFAILMGASLVIIYAAPGVRASDETITHYYSGSRDRLLEATVLYVLPLAGVCFLWFVAVLRYRLRLLEGSRLGLIATVQFASGIVFLALLFTAGAGFGAGIATELISTNQPDAASLREIIALSDALLFIYATRASAIFVLSTSLVGLRTGTLPRPLGWIGLLAALALLLASVLSIWFVLVFPVWVLVVSADQLRRRLTGAAEISGELHVR